MAIRKIRTLIRVDRVVWSQTKAYASLKGYNLSEALEKLLVEILSQKGYTIHHEPSRSEKQVSNSCR